LRKTGFVKTPEIRKTENRQVQALITSSDPTGSGSYLVVSKGAYLAVDIRYGTPNLGKKFLVQFSKINKNYTGSEIKIRQNPN